MNEFKFSQEMAEEIISVLKTVPTDERNEVIFTHMHKFGIEINLSKTYHDIFDRCFVHWNQIAFTTTTGKGIEESDFKKDFPPVGVICTGKGVGESLPNDQRENYNLVISFILKIKPSPGEASMDVFSAFNLSRKN